MSIKRTHITPKVLKKIRPEMREQEIDSKPKGFWYGIDGDWERWCRAEEWGLADVSDEYELTLRDENLLQISSVEELDAFHKVYHAHIGGFIRNYIDWEAVAEKYDGIEIAPYQWERRLDGPAHRWYYGWDCASGCIWRPKGVTIKLIGKVKAKP